MELEVSGQVVRVVLPDTFKSEDIDYIKHVTGLDRTMVKRGGYAYEGNFVSGEVDLPVGALLLEGSSDKWRAYGGRTYKKLFLKLYRVTPGGELELIEGPDAMDDGSTCISKRPLTYFEFVERHLTGTVEPAKIKEIDAFTDKELLIELSKRGYFTIAEANELLETRRMGYKPEPPPPDQRCRRIKQDGEQCTRRARKGLDTCWQHPR